MNSKFLSISAAATAALLLTTTRLSAQSAYSTAVNSLNPAGYWPMHEVEPAAQGDIETNYGTLGPLGEGFYPDWATPTPWIVRGAPGILTNEDNRSVHFIRPGSGGPPGNTYTNALFVPHTSPLATLNPPFTVECWFYPTNYNSQDIWAQAGDVGLNSGNTASGLGSLAGLRLVWMSSAATGFQLYGLDGAQNNLGFTGVSGVNSSPSNNWYYLVVTCDANTNFSIYTNGVQAPQNSVGGTAVNGPGFYTPDYWSPMTIGGGHGGGGGKAVAGFVDEFAVYTNVISDITTHYSDAINNQTHYFYDVTNDNPVIYLRMNAPAGYTAPGVGSWPALVNDGTTNGVAVGNGVYSPGTAPGLLSGAPVNPNGIPFGGVPGNLAAMNGVSGYADAGYAAAYNPIGATPFSVTALFRGNPCDGRMNTIVGHSDNSWNLSLNNTGHLFWRFGTNTPANLNSVGVYNDGLWHQAIVVYTPNSNPTLPGTNALYVDGTLDFLTNNASVNGFLPGTNSDVFIGSDPQYTNNLAGVGRSFAGQICDVAIFTNALTASQVQTLYSGCEVTPYITTQPVANNAVDGGTGSFINIGVAVKGSPTLSYQWYYNTTPVYSGATQLGSGGQYINPTTTQLTITNLTGSNSGYYYAIIHNNYGSVTSIVASLTVYTAPSILSQIPVTYNTAAGTDILTNYLTLYAGANPLFVVTNAGAVPIGYQWSSNGVPIAGATGNSVNLTNVQIGAFNISCAATNFLGGFTDLWSATVIADPTNNSNGLAPYPQAVLANNPIGYWRLNEGNDNNNGDDGYLALDYAGGDNGLYTNMILGESAGYSPTTDPSDLAAIFAGFGSLPAINSLAGQIRGIDFAATNGANGEFTVEAWANGVNGGEPQIIGGPLAAKGIYGVDDEFNLGIDTTKVHYRFYVRNALGTMYVVGSGSMPPLDNNWHHVVGVCDEANGLLGLFYDGKLVNTASIPTNSGVYEAPEPMTIGAGTTDGVNYGNQFNGYINDVAVYNHAFTLAQVQAQYSSVGGGVPPYFIQKSFTATNLISGGTLFIPTPIAAGTPVLGYYWYDVGGGTNVAAGTTNGSILNAALTVPNVSGFWNNDTLELFVTNAFGTTNYSVTLMVATNVQITQNIPAKVEIVSGDSYTYSIGAVSPPPFGYQWYNGGTLIPGQNNSTYTVTAGSPGTSTTYYVVVTNAYESVTSTISSFTSLAQLANTYATSILQLHPVDYWPLQETNAPALATIETNYGSLGALGNAYYAATNPADVIFQQAGLPGSNDLSTYFTAVGTATPDSFAFVPRVSPAVTFTPPFTMEVWLNSTTPSSNTHSNTADVLSEEGSGLDSTAGNGNFGGARMAWVYDANTAGPGVALLPANGSGGTIGDWEFPVSAGNVWYHYVVTYDGANFNAYVNGALVGTEPFSMALDTWTPLTIGAGRWQGEVPTRAYNGFETEVAVYTNVLSVTQITNDYLAGITVGSNYAQTVLNNNPLLYYRMDCTGYTNLSPLLCPVAVDYGPNPQDGYYAGGTVPAEESGPAILGMNTNYAAVINGITSCINVGYDSLLNPTGTQPFTAMAWFKSNPSDGRMQTIMSHGGNTSWALNLVGTNGNVSWSSGAGSVVSPGLYNDGNWHLAAGVYDGVNNYLYLDGSLSISSAASGSITGNTTDGVFLGGDPDFTLVGNNQRYFAGAIAQAAFFTNALTAAQIQQIYTTAIGIIVNPNPPKIVVAVTNNVLYLSWPADHIGWQLQAITNPVTVGMVTNVPIGNNWANYNPSTGPSTATNLVAIPFNLTKGTVFYRLTY